MEPVIIVPRRITRGFCKAHPDWVFLYGHDVQEKGFEGHGQIHGEENAFPVLVLYKFCPSGHRLFMDSDSIAWQLMRQSLEKVRHVKRPIIPLQRIGDGCSRMSELAPKMFKEMSDMLEKIQYPNIKRDYTI